MNTRESSSAGRPRAVNRLTLLAAHVTPDTLAAIRALAEQEDRPVSQYVRRVLERHIEDQAAQEYGGRAA